MKFQVIGPAGMSVNHTPFPSVAIGQMPFSRITQTPAAGDPSAWRIVPMTRALPGVIVGPGVGNGVVPGSGVASGVGSGCPRDAADGSGLGGGAFEGALNGVAVGDAVWVGGGAEDGAGSAPGAHAASSSPVARAIPKCFIPFMFRYLTESAVARSAPRVVW